MTDYKATSDTKDSQVGKQQATVRVGETNVRAIVIEPKIGPENRKYTQKKNASEYARTAIFVRAPSMTLLS